MRAYIEVKEMGKTEGRQKFLVCKLFYWRQV